MDKFKDIHFHRELNHISVNLCLQSQDRLLSILNQTITWYMMKIGCTNNDATLGDRKRQKNIGVRTNGCEDNIPTFETTFS